MDAAAKHWPTVEIPGLAGPRGAEPTLPTPMEPRHSELRPGTRLGRYRVQRCIGRGGMGAVYVGHDPRLDRSVALKVTHHRGSQARRSAAARIAREARMLAQVCHPNVVEVFDVGSWSGGTFVAMERVHGRPLTHWLRARPRRPRSVVDVFAQAGAGLSAIHRAGLVHRDFKPANAVLGDDGRVRVLDFGLAVTTGSLTPATTGGGDGSARLTTTGTALGTPAYMAPEQHTGGTVDSRTDQYAFCLALYEALCGHPPYSAPSVRELINLKLTQPLSPPRAVPRRLRHPLLRGLEASRHRRWPTMSALLTALTR